MEMKMYYHKKKGGEALLELALSSKEANKGEQ
jgi:hypothetical protein